MSHIDIEIIFEEINNDLILFCEDNSKNINQKIINTHLIFHKIFINEENLNITENIIKKYFFEFIEIQTEKLLKKNPEIEMIKNFLNFYNKIEKYQNILDTLFSNQLRYISKKKNKFRKFKIIIYKDNFF